MILLMPKLGRWWNGDQGEDFEDILSRMAHRKICPKCKTVHTSTTQECADCLFKERPTDVKKSPYDE